MYLSTIFFKGLTVLMLKALNLQIGYQIVFEIRQMVDESGFFLRKVDYINSKQRVIFKEIQKYNEIQGQCVEVLGMLKEKYILTERRKCLGI